MWVNNEIFAEFLDSTFTVLLRLRLAQTRTANQKSYEKKQELTATATEATSIYREYKRSIISEE